MALVVRPLIAEINSQYSQIPSEMNAYCTLTIHQQRKYTSMYSFNGNQANWEDYIIFDIADPQTDLWIELWIQQFGVDRKIGEGHVDLKKHYHRSSYRQSEKMELKNMDRSSGVLRLTIQYKSSKQEVEKMKRKLSIDKQVIVAPVIETQPVPINILKTPVTIDKTPSLVYYHPNSMEQSFCGNIDTAGYGYAGYNNVAISNIGNESISNSMADVVHGQRQKEIDNFSNQPTTIAQMTPQQYLNYVQMNPNQQNYTNSNLNMNHNPNYNPQLNQGIEQQNQNYSNNMYVNQQNFNGQQLQQNLLAQQNQFMTSPQQQQYPQYNNQQMQPQPQSQPQQKQIQPQQFNQQQQFQQYGNQQIPQMQQMQGQAQSQSPNIQIPNMMIPQGQFNQANFNPQTTQRGNANQYVPQQAFYNNMRR